MSTLYRQYRPQRFSEVYGQPHITDTLSRALTTDKTAHAYLFHGPRGTGKTSTARILAKRLNCKEPEGAEPCGKCAACEAIGRGQNMDIIEIDAASNRGIDDIRALKDGIGLSPSMSRYKVYIIDEVHMLTHEAFTALLKTLEEPVKHAVFILATTEFHKVPETILSRCQVYRFRRATVEEMRARLQFLLQQEKREAEDDALNFIIARSDGCYRDAESLLGQVLTLQEGPVTLQNLTEFMGLPPQAMLDQFLTALVKGESAPAVAAVDEAYARGFDPEQVIKEAIVLARDGALSLIKKEVKDGQFVKEAGASVRLPAIIRVLIQAVQDLAYVPQPLLALHLAIVTVCNKQGEAAKVVSPTPPVVAAPVAPRLIPQEPSDAKEKVVSSVPPPAGGGVGGGLPGAEPIKKIWMQFIQNVKMTNPVASTFLRAMEPASYDGATVRLQAFYALHRNFFDKPENRGPIEAELSKLLGSPVSVRPFLAEAGPAAAVTVQQKRQQQEEELADTVKEVFGSN